MLMYMPRAMKRDCANTHLYKPSSKIFLCKLFLKNFQEKKKLNFFFFNEDCFTIN